MSNSAKTAKPQVQVRNDVLQLGEVSITFHRTLRIPDNDSTYALPPSLGHFPLRRVSDYADRVPESWREHGGVFLPMYQREAAWLSFEGPSWRPHAVKVGLGRVNALSGEQWDERLRRARDEIQDYMVVPGQPWLDGINAGDGFIKQFVAMPLGMGYTVEGQVTGKEEHGGLQIAVFEPKPGRFPEQPPATRSFGTSRGGLLGMSGQAMGHKAQGLECYNVTAAAAPLAADLAGAEMGLAGGGRMRQKIYPDPHGLDAWDQDNHARVFVHIVNSQMWQQITGEPLPPTPVSAQTYAQHGLPWFDLYDEDRGDIAAPDTLAKVKSVAEKDAEHGFSGQQDDSPVKPPVKKLPPPPPAPDPYTVVDGRW